MKVQSESMWIESVGGAKNIGNVAWACVVWLGAAGFLIAGLSSYLKLDLIWLLPSQAILFSPQGLVMCFYGTGGLFLSGYLLCTVFWDVGGGHNEFDRQEGTLSLFRWGFPGENRRIRVRSSIRSIQAIKLETSGTWSSRYRVVLRFKDQQQLALTQAAEPLDLRQIEARAAQLAQFLQVPIEGL